VDSGDLPSGDELTVAPSAGAAASDSSLSSDSHGDVAFLESLGYKQVLQRRLGMFASFGVLFSIIGVTVSVYTLYGYGLTTAGPFFIWAFIIGGALQVVVGLSIAELVSAYPIAGGAYQIVNRIKQGVLAWQTGWLLLIALVVSVSTNATAIASYFGSQVGWNNLTHWDTIAIAFVVILLITIINIVGVRYSALVNNVGITCEALGLGVIVVLLMAKGLIHPISFINNKGGTDTHGFLWPFLFAFLFPVYMINAFDSTGHTGEETVDAARKAPRAAVTANTAAYLFALLAIIVVTLSISKLGPIQASSTPVTDIVSARLGSAFGTFLTVIVIVSFLVASQMLQLTGARIIWAQARDKKMPFPKLFSKIGSGHSPTIATIAAGILALLFCLFSSVLAVLAAMVALAFSVANVITVGAGLWAKARGRLPAHPWRYGRVGVLFDVVSILWSAFIAVVLIKQSPGEVGKGFAYVVAAGLLIYYVGIPLQARWAKGSSAALTDASDANA
jgi:amino acid transporter